MKHIINLVLIICALTVTALPATAEEPMINMKQLKEYVVVPTLQSMEEAFPGAANPAAANLIVGIAAHESTIGGVTYLKQQNGPALGIYQIEPLTHLDLWASYLNYHEDKAEMLLEFVPDDGIEYSGSADIPVFWVDDNRLITSLDYQTGIARAIIYRASFGAWPDPDDVEGLAKIWKSHWNTHLGAGTVEQYIEHFPREIL